MILLPSHVRLLLIISITIASSSPIVRIEQAVFDLPSSLSIVCGWVYYLLRELISFLSMATTTS